MLELEHALMAGRIMDARSEILRRLETLRDIPGLHEPERQAIRDALSGLRSVEREEVRYADQKHREPAQLAREKLRSIGPALERLKSSDMREQSWEPPPLGPVRQISFAQCPSVFIFELSFEDQR
jgi:hypothetical protein